MREFHAVRRIIADYESRLDDGEPKKPRRNQGDSCSSKRAKYTQDNQDDLEDVLEVLEVQWRSDVADSLLVGRARSAELRYWHMGPKTKRAFAIAMKAECSSFKNFDAVVVLPDHEVKALIAAGAKVIATR